MYHKFDTALFDISKVSVRYPTLASSLCCSTGRRNPLLSPYIERFLPLEFMLLWTINTEPQLLETLETPVARYETCWGPRRRQTARGQDGTKPSHRVVVVVVVVVVAAAEKGKKRAVNPRKSRSETL